MAISEDSTPASVDGVDYRSGSLTRCFVQNDLRDPRGLLLAFHRTTTDVK